MGTAGEREQGGDRDSPHAALGWPPSRAAPGCPWKSSLCHEGFLCVSLRLQLHLIYSVYVFPPLAKLFFW